MALSFAGNGTITGLSVGGLPDGTVDADTLASGVGGKVLQVVNFQTGTGATGSTTVPHDNTIPQNTEGTEFMTLAITPTSASSKLIIDVVAVIAHATGDTHCVFLCQDSTANALASVDTNAGNLENNTLFLRHYMTASTTSSTTFKVRAGSNSAGTFTFNGVNGNQKRGGTMASSITITEISA